MPRTICVVDDSQDNRMLLSAILSHESFEIIEYEDGETALEGITAARPDLMLLDISLPGMDGMEVLRRVRSDETLRTLPVIALTGHGASGDREKYLNAGFDGYLAKPLTDFAEVVATVERCMAAR